VEQIISLKTKAYQNGRKPCDKLQDPNGAWRICWTSRCPPGDHRRPWGVKKQAQDSTSTTTSGDDNTVSQGQDLRSTWHLTLQFRCQNDLHPGDRPAMSHFCWYYDPIAQMLILVAMQPLLFVYNLNSRDVWFVGIVMLVHSFQGGCHDAIELSRRPFDHSFHSFFGRNIVQILTKGCVNARGRIW
jgi:hypothetical protein